MKREAVIVSAARTPVGKCRGVLASVAARHLGAAAVKEAVARAGIHPNEIDDVIFGNLANNEVANMARMVALTAGFPVTVPGITIDRQCASGLNAVAYASILIEAGYGDVMVAGGVESDSTRCYVMEKPSAAYQMAPPRWTNVSVAPGEYDVGMGITAENVAAQYGLTREECDRFALKSHQKASAAWNAGHFDSQIVPIDITDHKGNIMQVRQDEAVRFDASLEQLSKLRPAFKPDGIVTAGNASPMSDGAGAVVLMERSLAEAKDCKIWGRVKSFASVGVDPLVMGTGPIYAIPKVLKQAGMSMADIDLFELNEAFASQSLACIHTLDLEESKLNVNGGAIALGHPTAGTGGILVAKLIYELERRNLSTGLISFCVGGGQGMAAIIERV